MSGEDLIGVYGDSYDVIRLGTGEFVEQLWLELGGPDVDRVDEFAGVALDVVNGANADIGAITEEFVDGYVATVSRTPPPSNIDPLDVAELTVDRLRGTLGRDVYSRPGIAVRKGLAAGKSFDVAMAEAATRAGAQAQADIALAHRQAAATAMDRHPDVNGYRRVLTGASCDLCRVASTQRYRRGDLMPIHTRCDCRIAPIVGDYDGGRIVNRELYRDLKRDGTLDRLNRSNRGTTGRSRARQAAARRQRRLDGLDQPELDLPPTQAPAVRSHGELGPVLVNERHAFTAAKRSVDTVDDAGDLARRAPDVDIDRPPSVNVPKDVPADVTPRSGRWTPETPSVIRAAQRRGVDPDVIIDELELKRAERLAEQRAEREFLRQLDDPASIPVREAAAAYDVSPDEIVAARAQVGEARRVVADAATRVQLEAFEQLDTWDVPTLAAPPRTRTPEWDWLGGLREEELKRLRRRWFDGVATPDVAAQLMETAGAGSGSLSVDDAMALWLDQTRRYEAAGALRRGRLPSEVAYSGRLDIDALLDSHLPADARFLPSEIVGKPDLDVAGRLAQLARQTDGAEAELYLRDALAARTGDPPPWRMTFQSFEAELRDLEYGLRNHPAELRSDAVDRLAELVPEYLDDPGTSYEELYSRIIATARRADLDVPPTSRIPWDGIDLDDTGIDDLIRRAELDEAAAATVDVYGGLDDVDAVAARWAERHADSTFKPGKMSADQAATLARTVEDLEQRFPIGYNIGAVGDLNAVSPAGRQTSIGIYGQASHPGARLVRDEAGNVAVAAGGTRNSSFLGVRPGGVDAADIDIAAKKADGWLATAHPQSLVVHEYGHHVGYTAELELLDRLVRGDIDYPARKRPVSLGDQMGRLWEEEVKNVLRDVDAEAARLPRNASFSRYKKVISRDLSNYGASNAREVIAESFAEFALEGDNARPLARAIAQRALELAENFTSRRTTT